MKTMKKYFLSMLVALFTIFTSQAQTYKGLPQKANDYITKHFSGYIISHYEKDSEILNVEHKVYVSNQAVSFKLDFNKNGDIKDIESLDDKTPLPKSVLPVKISQYVKANYPQAKIIEWKMRKNSQVVELNIDLELIFNGKGDFVRIDD